MPKINLARRPGTRSAHQYRQVVLKLDGQWGYHEGSIIGGRQRELMRRLSAADSCYHGLISDIGREMGYTPKTAWKQVEKLFQKFGVYNRFQLHAIAKQLAKNGTRRRSSNQVSYV